MDQSNSKLVRDQFKANKISWKNSSLYGLSIDHNHQPIPWFSYPAIDYLKNKLQKNFRIFEYGCGSSSLFFSQYCQKVISLETNQIWFQVLSEKITKQYNFIQESSITKSLITSSAQQSASEKTPLNIPTKKFKKNTHELEIILMDNGLQNPNYQNYVNLFKEKFDIILIDSLKRYQCAINVINALNHGGIIILDDSQRSNYQKIFDFFKNNNFQKIDFFGIAPGQLSIKNTTIFFQ